MKELELFSPMEQKVLKCFGRRKKMSITEITEKLYGEWSVWGTTVPMDANSHVAAYVRRINVKCNYHKLPWFLNGSGRGRGGKTVWKDKR